MNTAFPNLVMLYADHIMRGLRTIDTVPPILVDDVKWVLDDLKKNKEGEEWWWRDSPPADSFLVFYYKDVRRIALSPINKRLEFDAVSKQEEIIRLTSEFGSLAFMYAKHVHKGLRPIELVPERMVESTQAIMAYIDTHNLENLYD